MPARPKQFVKGPQVKNLRILCFYRHDPAYTYDDWLHMHFMASVAKYPGIQLTCYGPGLNKYYRELAPIPYNSKLTAGELVSKTQADAVLVMTKARAFHNYHPAGIYGECPNLCWLPVDFPDLAVPKLVLEEDYHYETDDRWYQEQGINLILQRHPLSALRQDVVPMAWFPFSVDIGTFKPPANPRRRRKICLVGAITKHIYIHRQRAREQLQPSGMLVTATRSQVIVKRGARRIRTTSEGVYGQDYVTCLQSYVCHLSGTSKYSICPAKMFEIMASGSVLLTNYEPFFEELFPPNAYVTFGENDVVERARRIVEDHRFCEETTAAALTCIKAKHSHQVRIGQLKQHIAAAQKEASTNVEPDPYACESSPDR